MRFLNLLANKFFALLFSWLLGQQVRGHAVRHQGALSRGLRADRRAAAPTSATSIRSATSTCSSARRASTCGSRPGDPLPRAHATATTNISRFRHGWLLLADERVRRPQAQVPVSQPNRASAERLASEIEHHREIADQAEAIWNWDSPSGTRRADRRARLFVECGGLGPGERALELGCGTGVFLSRVSGCRASIVGLDLSRDLLGRARPQPEEHGNLSLACGNAERLPFPDACFDVVYGSSVLHHLDLAAAAAEACRVLRPGGRAVFTEPNILNPQVVLTFQDLAAAPLVSASRPTSEPSHALTAARILRQAGFTDVSSEPYDFLHPCRAGPAGRPWSSASRWGSSASRCCARSRARRSSGPAGRDASGVHVRD